MRRSGSSRNGTRRRGSLVLVAALSLAWANGAATAADAPAAGPPAAAALPDPARARAFLASVRPSADLQAFLDGAIAEIGREDPRFLASAPRVAVIDLARPDEPVLAELRGSVPVYPASVVKFAYLMAAYAWQESGLLTIDPALDAELGDMIRESSNQATQKVFARLTGTTPGPELDGQDYARYRDRRLAVERWLQSLGIDDLHAVNPTFDGGGDLHGREQQFLRDRTVAGGLPAAGEQYPNRNAMTASGTAKLLALLALDLALTPRDSQAVRRRMLRDVREQPHLVHRIAGGVSGLPGAEAWSKSGTWGPIYADAGVVHAASGRQFTLAVFTDASPPYRGDAIASLARRLAARLLAPAAVEGGAP